MKINPQKSLIMANLSLSVIFFGTHTVKRGIIRAKAQFSAWVENDGLFKNFFDMHRDSKFVFGEMLARINQLC